MEYFVDDESTEEELEAGQMSFPSWRMEASAKALSSSSRTVKRGS